MDNTLSNTGASIQTGRAAGREMSTFFLIWAGQVVSILGSGMTGFALGIWIFQQTGSATSFALILLFNMLPKALVAPLAGVLADRYDRRRIMILTDLFAGLATVILAALFFFDALSVWHVYILTALNAGASGLQGPAFSAAVTQLVPKTQFGRANGLLQLGEGIGLVIAPVLAGLLVGILGLASVLLLDLLTFLIAVGTLLAVRFPAYGLDEKPSSRDRATWLGQLKQAVRYLKKRPGLSGLMLIFALVNFFVGTAEAVLTPMILSFTGPETLGIIMTIGGIGMLVGSIIMSATGGGERKVITLFGAYALLGLGVFLAGLRPSASLVALAAFLAFFHLPAVMSTSQAILQAKVAPEIQGRVFGLRITLNTFSFATAYLLGGLLADRIFEPWMMPSGLLASSFGRILGVGAGRGMGLMFILMGILSVLTALSAFANPRIRRVEIELPDHADFPGN